MSTYIVAGIVLGGIYAIAAVGLTMTYVASRVFNFAHGAEAFALAFFFYDLHTLHGWPVWSAGLVTLALAAPLLGLVLWALVFRRLTSAPTVVQLVATIGLFVALPALALVVFGNHEPLQAPGFFSQPAGTYSVAGIIVNTNQVAVAVAAVVVATALSLLFQRTQIGLKLRGVVDDPALASVIGINPSVLVALSWVLGTVLAGLAGVLLLPIFGLDEGSFTLLIVAAFAAVVIARLRSLLWTFLGALGLGLLQELLLEAVPKGGTLAQGVQSSTPFAVMIAFVLAYTVIDRHRMRRASGLAGEEDRPLTVALVRSTQITWQRIALPGVLVAAVVVLPFLLSSFWLGIVGSGILLAISLVSYNVVTGEGGMISLCQISLSGISACTAAQLATTYHWPVILAILCGALVSVPVGMIIAAISCRLNTLYFGLVTLSFGLLADNLIFTINQFAQNGSGVALGTISLAGFSFSTQWRQYYLGIVIFLIVALIVINLRHSIGGMALGATRTSEQAAKTIGLNTGWAKIWTFGFAAAIAGLGGALAASVTGFAVPSSFSSSIGLVWLAVIVTFGARSLGGALMAGIAFTLVPALFNAFLPASWGNVPAVLFGMGAIAVASNPGGIIISIGDHLGRLVNWLRVRTRGDSARVPTAIQSP
ncbi:MAG: ABC transporter permease [Actinobacteria bacterium]|nr:ABC transporter permease [Actinomycetota bacterium]